MGTAVQIQNIGDSCLSVGCQIEHMQQEQVQKTMEGSKPYTVSWLFVFYVFWS